jgi:hypothetical protein
MQARLIEIMNELRDMRQKLMDAEEASNVHSTSRKTAVSHISSSIVYIESAVKYLEKFSKV